MNTFPGYPVEVLSEDDDNGTMPNSLAALAEQVVGQRIVAVERAQWQVPRYEGSSSFYTETGTVITLSNGLKVRMAEDGDCCAFTEVRSFLLHPEKIDHVITGVGTTDAYTTWHIYADMGDVLELSVGWSCGNPFYYGYGFTITVDNTIVVHESTPRRPLPDLEVPGD